MIDYAKPPFTLCTYPTLDPPLVDHDRDDSVLTAWTWTLHVRVPSDYSVLGFIEYVRRQVDPAICLLPIDEDNHRPAMIGGDSFTEWGEAFDPNRKGGDHRALHLYVTAPDPTCAVGVGVAFMALTGLGLTDVALSTAGDWAEQVEMPAVLGHNVVVIR